METGNTNVTRPSARLGTRPLAQSATSTVLCSICAGENHRKTIISTLIRSYLHTQIKSSRVSRITSEASRGHFHCHLLYYLRVYIVVDVVRPHAMRKR